jgi:hypothetical protein
MAKYFASASDAGVLSRFSKENTDVADLVIKTLDSETAISVTAEGGRYSSVWSFPEAGSPAEFEIYASVIASDSSAWVAGVVGLFENITNFIVGSTFSSAHGVVVDVLENPGNNILLFAFGLIDPQIQKSGIRLRVSGLGTAKAIKLKVWQGAEPSAWSAEGNYVLNNSSGLVGISIPSVDQGIVSYGIGTNGDTAPSAPVATGPNTPINPSITNLLATSARLNWEQG